MKSFNLRTPGKTFLMATAAVLMILGFNSCAKKTTATSSTVVADESSKPFILPEEKGKMEVKRDANSNYVIQINISDLEAVKKMEPAREAYVVWMITENNQTKNLGQIEGANTWLSKKEKASFEAVTPLKPSKVFITAENDAMAQRPGSQIVWSTKSF